MKAKEFKALREAIGISVTWLAAEAGVSPDTVRAWEQGRAAIPQGAVETVRELDRLTDYLSDIILEQVLAQGSEKANLMFYKSDEDYWAFHPEDRRFPAAFHAVMLEKAKKKLAGKGLQTEMVHMDRESYFEWLGKKEDTPETRSAWVDRRDEILAEQALKKAENRHGDSSQTRSLKIKVPKHFRERIVMPAERFNDLVRKYGLSFECVAMIEEVPVETVQNWASGKTPVPRDVEYGLEYAGEAIERAVEMAFENAFRQLGPPPADEASDAVVFLPVFENDEDMQFFRPSAEYFPSRSQAVVISKIAKKLADAGYMASTVTLTRDEYTQWRGKRKDTTKLRERWMHQKLTGPDGDTDALLPALTGQEFRMLRESVGLSASQLAKLTGFKSGDVLKWESGEKTPEYAAVSMLVGLDADLASMVEEIRKTMLELDAEGEKPPVFSFPAFKDEKDLWKYFTGFRNFPVSTHTALLARIEKMLHEISILPMFYEFDRTAYQKWLGNRKDNLEMLAQWDRFLSMTGNPGLAN